MKYIIEGRNILNGEVTISGNKNAVFPTVAASLLTSEPVVLKNVPNINDTQVLVTLLQRIGAEVSYDQISHELKITAKELNWELPEDLMVKLRGSIVLVGALLARHKKVKFHHPGGDVIGRRSIGVHIEAFRGLGALVKQEDLNYYLEINGATDKDCEIFMSEPSVTATENAIVAAALGQRQVKIKNCATEPHVVDLCNMLVKMGVSIDGIGSNILTIQAVSSLRGVEFTIGVDVIEIGTYAIATAITGGTINMKGNFKEDELKPILFVLNKFGIETKLEKNNLTVLTKGLVGVDTIKTNVWPGFPTDMMSGVIVLATQSKSMTLCHDWMYESRMFFVDKLINMGANITLADPHRVIIFGPSNLKGRELETPDIRAGMALVLAALVADGQSVINRAELIERGYEGVVEKLSSLGAVIERIE